MLINPLTRDDISTGRTGNKLPGGVLDKGIEFRAHGLAPVGIIEGGSVVRGYGRGGGEGAEIEQTLSFEDAILGMGAHGMRG
jgi:hypothetical protein